MELRDPHAKGRIKQCSKQPAIKQPTAADTACHALVCDPPGHCEANGALVRQLCSATALQKFQAYVRALERAHSLPLFLSVFDLLFGSPAPCRLFLHERASTSFAYVNHKVRRPSPFVS